MRIISGKFKGRTISPDKNLKARPTTDFAKEALFNILENTFDIENISFLDLFSGTGSIAYEMASRGCTSIDVVEANANHLRFIKKMVAKLEFEGFSFFQTDAFRVIKKIKKKYHIIFVDPPYQDDRVNSIPEDVFTSGLLEPDGLLIIEHSSKRKFHDLPNFLEVRNYGGVYFSFFKN